MMRLELIKLNKYKVYDEFDMADVIKSNPEFAQECYGQNCLIKLGNALNTDYVMCGSFDLLGNKIESEKFVEENITDYNQITFYDDDQLSIQTALNINSVLEKYLLLTEDSTKILIKDKIKKDDNFLIIKEYTHNKSKKFNEHNVQLELNNVIKSFENWKWKRD